MKNEYDQLYHVSKYYRLEVLVTVRYSVQVNCRRTYKALIEGKCKIEGILYFLP